MDPSSDSSTSCKVLVHTDVEVGAIRRIGTRTVRRCPRGPQSHRFDDKELELLLPRALGGSKHGSTQKGFIIYAIGVLESRIGGSAFWILPRSGS